MRLLGTLALATLLGTGGAAVAAPGAPPSSAARRQAKAIHDEALKDYNLGRFAEARDGFARAYELAGDPVLLFNAAQCERHLGRHEQAIFLYRRYLEAAPAARNRSDVERRIGEFERAAADRPARTVAPSPSAPAPSAPPPPAAAEEPPAVVVAPAPAPPEPPAARLRLTLDGGIGHLRFDRHPQERAWDQPFPAVAFLGGEYAALRRGGTTFAAAAAVGLSPVTYWVRDGHASNDRQDRSFATSLLAEARALRRLSRDLQIGASLGGGVLWWSGLRAGNPFTMNGVAPDGAVLLPALRASVSAEIPVGGGLSLRVSPAYTVATTESTAFEYTLAALHRLELLVGVALPLR